MCASDDLACFGHIVAPHTELAAALNRGSGCRSDFGSSEIPIADFLLTGPRTGA
jgi:hypothetical protein